ncbi:hypothetical protein ASC92_25835 [Variovorax sp. Root411]|nr:hypothetical protein ASC92_25835 [Variovorax sp. Root411]
MRDLARSHPEDDNLDLLGTQAMSQRHLEWNSVKLNDRRVDQLNVTRDRSGPIAYVHKAAKALATSMGPAVVLVAEANGLAKVVITPLGEQLARAFETDFALIHEEYQPYAFSPVYMLMQRIARLFPLKFRGSLNKSLSLKDAETLVRKIECVIGVLRRSLSAPELKQAQQNFRRNAIANFNGLCDGFDWLAERHEEAVVLRFEVFLRPHDSQPVNFGEKPDLALLDEFHPLCTRFQRFMAHHFGKALLLGFAWTLEHGRESGFHKHFVVVLRARGNEDHVAVVEQLIRKWEQLTGGRGHAHSSNKDGGRHHRRAVGLVNLRDPQVAAGLRRIAAYFTLAGLFVKLDVPQSFDTFGKGRFPKKPLPTDLAGRPRKRPPGSRIRMSVTQYEKNHLHFM